MSENSGCRDRFCCQRQNEKLYIQVTQEIRREKTFLLEEIMRGLQRTFQIK